MSESRLVHSGQGDWHHWTPPEGFRPPRRSPSSRRRLNNPKRRQRIRRRVLERDGYRCTYCGEEATTTDHVISLANGGDDSEENQVAACEPCNKTLGWLGL